MNLFMARGSSRRHSSGEIERSVDGFNQIAETAPASVASRNHLVMGGSRSMLSWANIGTQATRLWT